MRSHPKITDEPASGPAPRRAEHPQDRALTTTEGGTREASTKWKGKNPCVAWEGVWADRRTNAATAVTDESRRLLTGDLPRTTYHSGPMVPG